MQQWIQRWRCSSWHAIDIYNLLWPKLIDNLIRNEVLSMFKLNNLQVKAFDEFIIDPLSTIVIKKTLHIGGIVGIGKSQIMKSICEHFKKDVYMTC